MPGVEEPLVVFLDEVAVGGIGDFELEPQLLELRGLRLREGIADCGGCSAVLDLTGREGRVGALKPGLARAGRPVGHDRRPGAQHVDAGILQAPDVEIAE